MRLHVTQQLDGGDTRVDPTGDHVAARDAIEARRDMRTRHRVSLARRLVGFVDGFQDRIPR
jgi:hypothetical protein